MAKLESKFQKELIDEIKREYPGCIVLKNYQDYIQGFPDWTILWKNIFIFLKQKMVHVKLECQKILNKEKKQYHVLEIVKLLIYSIHRSVLMHIR